MKQILSSLITLIFFSLAVYPQNVWQVETYPDEIGFTRRNAGMLHKISAREIGERDKAFSKCPDTQLPVRTWAVKGENVLPLLTLIFGLLPAHSQYSTFIIDDFTDTAARIDLSEKIVEINNYDYKPVLLNDVPNGIYILKINYSHQTLTKKFSVKN